MAVDVLEGPELSTITPAIGSLLAARHALAAGYPHSTYMIGGQQSGQPCAGLPVNVSRYSSPDELVLAYCRPAALTSGDTVGTSGHGIGGGPRSSSPACPPSEF